MTQRLRYRVPAEHAGTRLDQFLAAQDNGLSRGVVRKLIGQGAAYVAARRVKRVSHRVREGDRVDLYPTPLDTAADPSDILRVVYEDEAIVVLDKPAGVAVQPRREGDVGTLSWALEKRAATGRRKPYVGIVHRLDQRASGLVVFARSRPAARSLAAAFAAHTPTRRYLAVVDGEVDWDRKVIALPLTSRGGMALVDEAAGKTARTRVECLERGRRSLLAAELDTGRMHQVRAHLAAVGYPIVGDRRYGGTPATLPGRIALHATRLAFSHPLTGATIDVTSPLPAELRALL